MKSDLQRPPRRYSQIPFAESVDIFLPLLRGGRQEPVVPRCSECGQKLSVCRDDKPQSRMMSNKGETK